jgi:hypothetical protein
VSGGEPHEIGFGVTGAIPLRKHGILRFKENLIIGADEDGPEGVVAMFAGTPCDRDGGSQMLKVFTVHAMASVVLRDRLLARSQSLWQQHQFRDGT